MSFAPLRAMGCVSTHSRALAFLHYGRHSCQLRYIFGRLLVRYPKKALGGEVGEERAVTLLVYALKIVHRLHEHPEDKAVAGDVGHCLLDGGHITELRELVQGK